MRGLFAKDLRNHSNIVLLEYSHFPQRHLSVPSFIHIFTSVTGLLEHSTSFDNSFTWAFNFIGQKLYLSIQFQKLYLSIQFHCAKALLEHSISKALLEHWESLLQQKVCLLEHCCGLCLSPCSLDKHRAVMCAAPLVPPDRAYVGLAQASQQARVQDTNVCF